MEVYFWVFATVIVLSSIGRVYTLIKGSSNPDVQVSLYDLFESLIGVLGVVGIYGYLNGLEFGYKPLWQVVFVFLIVTSIYSLIKPVNKLAYKKIGKVKSIILFGGMLMFSIPATYMLGLYAFYS